MTDKPITPETVRAALDAATPGPWAVEYKHGTTRLIAGGDCIMCDETYYPWVPDNDKDWHLTAMAPDLATAYLAQAEEIERLRKRFKAADAVTPAARDVASERNRQISEEGWDDIHDDMHTQGELACAAACYALNDTPRDEALFIHGQWKDPRDLFWPWDASWWKPKDRRRDLVRAAALILAEIERIDRATEGQSNE